MAAPGLAFGQAAGLPAGQGKAACITVQNNANGSFPVELRTGTFRPITFAADVGAPLQFCLPVRIGADQKIEVKVKSWMNPVGICLLPAGGRVEIARITLANRTQMNEVRCR